VYLSSDRGWHPFFPPNPDRADTIQRFEYFGNTVLHDIHGLISLLLISSTGPWNDGEACVAIECGMLMTPFDNMALISPDIRQEDVDYHTKVFREAVISFLG
jgi:hypothetical protein